MIAVKRSSNGGEDALAARKRVLVVDDDEVVVKSYQRVLSEAGYEVDGALSGPDALEEARRQSYDLVLTDLKMPGMDGMTVIRSLRKSHPDLPIVVITGYPSNETVLDAKELGVQDYLTKPLAPEALTRATAHALSAAPSPAAATATLPAAASVAAPPAVEAPAVEAPAVEPPLEVAATDEVEGGFWRCAGALIAAPLLGLAYVVFLPFLGFAIALSIAASGLYGAVRSRWGA